VTLDPTLAALADYGRKLGRAISGDDWRPTAEALVDFGKELFAWIFRGSLLELYQRLPSSAVSVQILSDRTEIREIPWEYMVTPDFQPAPHRSRSIVRVQLTCGPYTPRPKKFGSKVRVLFVSADPIDLPGVTWRDVSDKIETALAAHSKRDATIKIVEGATRETLLDAITRERFDVFHFFGHGDVQGGVGHLVLQDIDSGRSDFLSASDLARAFAGTGVRLAILSACLTGAGNFSDDFGVISTALIRGGIPAVVANQYPIPYKSISPFVGTIYRSLMLNGDIDEAVAHGRVALSLLLKGATRGEAVVEWGIPTLYRLANARKLFK
jgi:hypothetical protein